MRKRVISQSMTVICGLWMIGACAADAPLLEDETFADKMRSLGAERSDPDRLQKAKSMAVSHRLSSLQVKAMAARLGDDTARFEFALAAYPRTVDPENFYEVYDAFHSFSKVMRLHDQIRPGRNPAPVPVPITIHPPTAEDLKGILRALRNESFDQNRMQLARQILTSGGRKFLSTQIKRMLDCLDFENAKLELAKFAYDFTLDREQYNFVVSDSFSFASNRENLSKYIQSRQATQR